MSRPGSQLHQPLGQRLFTAGDAVSVSIQQTENLYLGIGGNRIRHLQFLDWGSVLSLQRQRHLGGSPEFFTFFKLFPYILQ